MSVTVDIWTDINCPFCYLGKKRFLDALDGFDHRDDVHVMHRSFELDPTLGPEDTGSVEQHIAGKYGISVEQARANEDRIGAQAAEIGLPYQTRGRDFGSSFDMHRLLHHALAAGRQEELLDALYDANFGTPEPLFGDRERLVAVAVAAGLDETDVRRVLADPDVHAEDVRRDEQQATALGVTGVPFFVIGGKYAVSGAQPTEVFGRALQMAWADQPTLVDVSADDATTCGPDGCEIPAARS
ncbi:DsbA family oxidoreductase [Gordonia bronchialis]|uniref:DsbA family oxidoreductase n=1 Tax=Gordonia bronchialis TaxID=2054 RepID=UPI00226F423F|nr:DsbA family oxidoreductase [Gordonia bronchialis]